MTPAPAQRTQRREDQLWFKAVERLGLPAVLCLGIFWAWDRSVTAERELAAAREIRLTAALSKLATSIDGLNVTTIGQGERMAQLASRVERLEDLGARAMSRHVNPPR